MNFKKRILVAPLNWGLGHATRCIPIINALLAHGFLPIIASDGEALNLLKKEFPELIALELPSYNISYPKKGRNFRLKLLWNSPKVLQAIQSEKKMVKAILKEHSVDGIISDNRPGVRSSKVPSAFVSHQLNVLSGNTTWISSKMHQNIIKRFDECWVPDIEKEPNLSGRLGHLNESPIPIKYLGVISRFKKVETETSYDLLVLLSGPEPQRTLLEALLLEQLKKINHKVLFVKGKIEKEQSVITNNNITIANFMKSRELESAMNRSKVILARSGYTTILDLAKLEKKAFFIPTPGQFEQEYLANRLDKMGIAPFCTQNDFEITDLKKINSYSGFTGFDTATNFEALFGLFKGK